MRLIVNKLLLIGLSLVLGACSAATATEESPENTTEETVEANEETTERSIVVDEMTTTFYPEVTSLRDLTKEDLEWYDIIMTRLNAIDDFSGDRETVYEIAEEYGEDPEELWFNWLEIVNAKWYGENGDFAILPQDYSKMNTIIIEKNIVGEKIEPISAGHELDEGNLTTSAHQKLHVDGEPYTITYKIKHKDDFKVAEIIEFRVNGEKIDL